MERRGGAVLHFAVGAVDDFPTLRCRWSSSVLGFGGLQGCWSCEYIYTIDLLSGFGFSVLSIILSALSVGLGEGGRYSFGRMVF